MSQVYIPAELRRRVTEEGRSRCGYCLTSQTIVAVPMHIEHIVPLAAGGQTVPENLWLACPLCNRYKGVQTHAVDPETGERVPLFHPRAQRGKSILCGARMEQRSSGKRPWGGRPCRRYV